MTINQKYVLNKIKGENMYNYNLHKKLKEAGFNQKSLSRQTGIQESTISNIMNGKWNPSVREKKKIEKILGSIEWKLESEE